MINAVKEASCSTPPIPPYNRNTFILGMQFLFILFCNVLCHVFDKIKLFAKPFGVLTNNGKHLDLHFPVIDWISISEGPIGALCFNQICDCVANVHL